MSAKTDSRAEAIQEAIAIARVEAFQQDEVMMIWACMAPCVSPRGGGNCPLCEVILVYPNGIVSRERRNN